MMSAYDRWKSTPPRAYPAEGACLKCGASEWTARGQEEHCAGCGASAIHFRLDRCTGCHAQTAWLCRCDERREA